MARHSASAARVGSGRPANRPTNKAAATAIEVFLAVRIPDAAALAAHQNERPALAVAVQIRDRVQQVGNILLDQLGGVPGGNHSVLQSRYATVPKVLAARGIARR